MWKWAGAIIGGKWSTTDGVPHRWWPRRRETELTSSVKFLTLRKKENTGPFVSSRERKESAWRVLSVDWMGYRTSNCAAAEEPRPPPQTKNANSTRQPSTRFSSGVCRAWGGRTVCNQEAGSGCAASSQGTNMIYEEATWASPLLSACPTTTSTDYPTSWRSLYMCATEE